jgi:O-antigen/teichoic acid export membrane protein
VAAGSPPVDLATYNYLLASLTAFTFSQYVITYVDLVVIQMYRSTPDVGVYAVAYRGYTVLQALALASGPVLTPLFVSLRVANREPIVRQFVDRAVPQMAVIGSVLTGVVAALVGLVVDTVLGPSFHGAAEPLIVLLLANVAFFMANLVGSVLVLHERTRPLAAINVIGAGVNVALDFLLIGVLGVGIVGAAVATTCAVLFVWAGYMYLARISVGLPARANPVVFAPALVGIAAPLLHASFAIVCVGALGAIVVGIAVLWTGRMLAAEDAKMFTALDIPPAMKRLTLRVIAALGR